MKETRQKKRKLDILPGIGPNQISTFENPCQLFLALIVGPGWWYMKFGTWKKYNINSHIIENVPKNPNRLGSKQYCRVSISFLSRWKWLGMD